MGKLALIGLAVAVVALVAGVVTRPATFRVERSVGIAAPAGAAFARVNDLHAWIDWSPYEKKDPQMRRTYDGPRSGPGATYAWAGNG
jgi:hypothetical protein